MENASLINGDTPVVRGVDKKKLLIFGVSVVTVILLGTLGIAILSGGWTPLSSGRHHQTTSPTSPSPTTQKPTTKPPTTKPGTTPPQCPGAPTPCPGSPTPCPGAPTPCPSPTTVPPSTQQNTTAPPTTFPFTTPPTCPSDNLMSCKPCSCLTITNLFNNFTTLLLNTTAGRCTPIPGGVYALPTVLPVAGCYSLTGNYTYVGFGFAFVWADSNVRLNLEGFAIRLTQENASALLWNGVENPQLQGQHGTIAYVGGGPSLSRLSFGIFGVSIGFALINDVKFDSLHRGIDVNSVRSFTVTNSQFIHIKGVDPTPGAGAGSTPASIIVRGVGEVYLDTLHFEDGISVIPVSSPLFLNNGRAVIVGGVVVNPSPANLRTQGGAAYVARNLQLRDGGVVFFRDVNSVLVENVVTSITEPAYPFNFLTIQRVNSSIVRDFSGVNLSPAFPVFDGIIAYSGNDQLYERISIIANPVGFSTDFGQLQSGVFRIGYDSSNNLALGNPSGRNEQVHGLILRDSIIQGGDSRQPNGTRAPNVILIDAFSAKVLIQDTQVTTAGPGHAATPANGTLSATNTTVFFPALNSSLIEVLGGAKEVVIDRCHLADSQGDGVRIDGAGTFPVANNNTLTYSLPNATNVIVKYTSIQTVQGCAIRNLGSSNLFFENTGTGNACDIAGPNPYPATNYFTP